MNLIGAFPADTILAGNAKEGKGFGLGDRFTQHDGREYVWLEAAGTITDAGFVCFYGAANTATMLSTANDARGNLVAIAPAAMAAGDQGWFQVKGPATARVLGLAAANARLNTTATAGAIDDDATGGSMAVDGIVITTTNGASAATVAALLNYPSVGATL